ncbi:MAG: hypothetical protein E6G23_05680 [Actinobacteria bacterium]|nr:MAG: hypothetical protein E6G23_05680 [Actinomycetota bacterium]
MVRRLRRALPRAPRRRRHERLGATPWRRRGAGPARGRRHSPRARYGQAEERGALLELARQRAGDWPASATAEIGDTPEDVATAKAAGFRSIAVSSPRTRDRAELAGADEIVDDMDGVIRALLSAGR